MFGTKHSVNPFEQAGTVEINTSYHATKKPLWLIALKLLGVAAMIAVGAAIAVPTLLEFEYPLWQAILVTALGMVVYTGIAFFIRPEPNTDNMGMGGGMGNDPYKSSDNANRFLWKLHCVLGPGRFTSETFLDTLAFVGLIKRDDPEEEAAPTFAGYAASPTARASTPPARSRRSIPIASRSRRPTR